MKLKTLFFALCLVLGAVVGYAMAADDGPAKFTIDVDHKGKAVKNFNHRMHQKMPEMGGKCVKCHHTMKKAGEKPQKCEVCHKDKTKKDPKTGAIGFKDAFHKTCRDCHKKKDKKYAKCKFCHG